MTLEEYAVNKLESLEADNKILRDKVQDTRDQLSKAWEAYEELKSFLKRHIQECTAASGYKMDKYFWENDPEYDFVASLAAENKPF